MLLDQEELSGNFPKAQASQVASDVTFFVPWLNV